MLAFREAGDELAAAAGTDVLNRLSMRLSHEINNPLTCNMAALNLALRELDQLRAKTALGDPGAHADTSDRERQLTRIERLLRDASAGATRVAAVVRELGSFALNDRELLPVRPAEVLELAFGLGVSDMLQGVRVVQHVSPAPMVRGSRWQLARVVAYAVQSAVEALDVQAGDATVEAEVGTDPRGWAELRVWTRGRLASGSERRSDSVAGATGVSMTLADHVVRAHGGELVVRRGTDTFTVSVRLPPMSAAAPIVAASGAPSPRASVLIVDDEPLIGRVLEITLQPSHDVTSVQSGASALALIGRGEAFDVILCDMTMPGMTGEEFYERLRSLRPDLSARVVFMSGGACSERAARFLQTMAGRTIAKPFDVDRLVSMLDERVAERAPVPRALPC